MCTWLERELGVTRFAEPPGGFDDVVPSLDVSSIKLLRRHDFRSPHRDIYEPVSCCGWVRSGSGLGLGQGQGAAWGQLLCMHSGLEAPYLRNDRHAMQHSGATVM